MHLLQEALIFLVATLIAVPIFKKLGLGTVLGYLAAGLAIGPWGLGAIAQVESVLHFAELGVVLLLFVIGLELQPSRLWQLRRTVFGLGSVQVIATAALLTLAALALGLPIRAAVIIGLGLSLSSTAFALQLLGEKKELASPYGQAAFGILLFQDLAVIPILAILPMLGDSDEPAGGSLWFSAGKVVVVLFGLVVAERFLVRRVFRIVAAARSQELFTATSLLVALGTAAAVSYVGMSMALGAFLAGVLLADSEYRHEIEADIEPFKGLLLGLFFIAVGMSVNAGIILERPLVILLLVLGLVAAKGLVLFAMGRAKFGNSEPASNLAIAISQGGEFAFVLFGLAVQFGVFDHHISDLLIVVVTLSMATTPLLFGAFERFIKPRMHAGPHRDFDVAPEQDARVIIAGFGRVGQVIGRILRAKRITFTALDASPEHIDFIRRFGNKVFYGDASRLDLLRAARAHKASILVLAIDDMEASVRTAQTALEHFPHLTIIARVRNRQHAYRLLALGVTRLFRETLESSLQMTVDVLESLGVTSEDAKLDVQRFREHDEKLLLSSYEYHKDEKKLVAVAAQARAELESLFERDTTNP